MGIAMSDNTTLRGPRDRSRIDVNEDYELRYWSEKFGCSHDELKKAVAQVGDRAEEVENYLKSSK
jgi:hypothetical protein